MTKRLLDHTQTQGTVKKGSKFKDGKNHAVKIVGAKAK
jgi:hypothetical protein